MFRQACAAADLWIGEMRPLQIDGRPVVVINHGDGISAFLDRCAHQGFPVSRGRLAGAVLTCAAHEWQYDARSGCGINPFGGTQTIIRARPKVRLRPKADARLGDGS